MWERALAIILLCIALILVGSSDTLHAFLLELLNRTNDLIATRPRWGAFSFVALAALSAVLTFFSSAVIVPVGVYTWGRWACIFLLWSGWVLGGMSTYAIGRFLGRPVTAVLSSKSSIARYEDRISSQTPFWMVFLFQAAMPSEVPGYLLGMARYSFWKYLAAVALLELPWAVGTVYVGEGLLERRLLLIVALGLAGAGVSSLALYLLHERLHKDKPVVRCTSGGLLQEPGVNHHGMSVRLQ